MAWWLDVPHPWYKYFQVENGVFKIFYYFKLYYLLSKDFYRTTSLFFIIAKISRNIIFNVEGFYSSVYLKKTKAYLFLSDCIDLKYTNKDTKHIFKIFLKPLT